MKLIPALLLMVFALQVLPAAAADPLLLEIETIDEESGQLSLVVSAFNDNAEPLPDLTAESFSAKLDGQPVTVDSIDLDASLLTTAIVLVVDVSGSMYGEPVEQARQGLRDLVANLKPSDEVAILTFASDVELVQEFSTDRSQISNAIDSIAVFGDTALYDAVIAGVDKAEQSSATRRLVVLLSDGLATVNEDNLDASLDAASSGDVKIIALGFGNQIDRVYLKDITSASGGRFLQAATPEELREAYVDLAAAIRSQYTLHITVPKSVDRTVRTRLELSLTVGDNTAEDLVILDPLEGAIAPDFNLSIAGLEVGQKLEAVTSIEPRAPAGVNLVSVDYLIDDVVVHSASGDTLAYELDGEMLSDGAHILKVVGIDDLGRQGQGVITFSIPAPAQPGPFSGIFKLVPYLLILVVLAALLSGGVVLLRRRQAAAENFVGRVKPWSGKELPETILPPEEWPERQKPAPRPSADRILGRVVVMDEHAIRNGDLSAIREYKIGTAPLTLGTSPSSDIQVDDDDGRLASEEAKVWVQKGRLAYHKLTTLSAMATEGVTSGWLFLGNGEEIVLGKYRILFQTDVPPDADEESTSDQVSQEEKAEAEQAIGELEDGRVEPVSVGDLRASEQAGADRTDGASDPDSSAPANIEDESPSLDTSPAEEPIAAAGHLSLEQRFSLEQAAREKSVEAADTGEATEEERPREPKPSNVTDAWINDGSGDEPGSEMDEETLLALRALEEASLQRPEPNASHDADAPVDSNDRPDRPGGNLLAS